MTIVTWRLIERPRAQAFRYKIHSAGMLTRSDLVVKQCSNESQDTACGLNGASEPVFNHATTWSRRLRLPLAPYPTNRIFGAVFSF